MAKKEDKILKKYIEKVLSSGYSNEFIQEYLFKLQILEEDDSTTETSVITLPKLKFIQLVTKLESMVLLLDVLDADDNVVCSDDFLKEKDTFKTRIINTLEETLEKGGELDEHNLL